MNQGEGLRGSFFFYFYFGTVRNFGKIGTFLKNIFRLKKNEEKEISDTTYFRDISKSLIN